MSAKDHRVRVPRRRKSLAPRRWVPVEPVAAPTNAFTFLSLPWHTPLAPSFLLSFHSQPTYLTFGSLFLISISQLFPLLLSHLHLDPSHHRFGLRTSVSLAPPTTFLSYKRVHVASRYGMPRHKAVLTTKRDLALNIRHLTFRVR